MADNFYDDSIQFMNDVLKLLHKEAKETESVYSVLLRLLGVSKEATSESSEPPDEATEDTPSLIHDYLKVKGNPEQVAYMNIALQSAKKRLLRQNLPRQKVKLRRTKKLIDKPDKPLETESLVKDTPEQTRKKLTQAQDELREEGSSKGIYSQNVAMQESLRLSTAKAAAIPDDIGTFYPILLSLLGVSTKEASQKIDQLNLQSAEIENEVNRLEDGEKMLFEGTPTFGGEDQTLSYINILDVLIFLTNTQKMKYDCSQCQYFVKGVKSKDGKAPTPACTFAGKGPGNPLTSPVATFDRNNNPTTGRQTKPSNSCKDVWGLTNNEYFVPSEDIKDFLEGVLKR